MKFEPVKNIVPNLIAWAKTQTPNYDIAWGFNCGEDSWFSWDFQNSIDWERATSEKYIGILNCNPFGGHYGSGESHNYKFLFVDGKIVCLSFEFGKSSKQFYWFEQNKSEIMGDLIQKFPKIEGEDGHILTDEISEKISSSCYMSFVTIDGELYQHNNLPSYGFLSGRGKKLLFKEINNELELVGKIEKCEGNWQREVFNLIDGTVVETKDGICDSVKYHMFQKVEV
jgi:hypothetical protein